ncbi:hypothetical protein CK203_090567 [Vitis vinifera]|uniref:Uncharacterized protein n=1 Tax=Vitis vinifera TaxID=29760 RepID=A0A438DKC8_VITVI|nr:hypothetical protein CK203_090567 [Vitis vinifera]
MLAFSPPLFSTFGWPWEDPISHEQNYIYQETEASESFLHLPSSEPQAELDYSTPCAAVSGNPTMVKKLNHNASERIVVRRSTAYTPLCVHSFQQQIKRSNVCIVFRLHCNEEIKHSFHSFTGAEIHTRTTTASGETDTKEGRAFYQRFLARRYNSPREAKKGHTCKLLSAVSANRLSDREIVVQISTFKVHESPLSEVLLNLEEDGLLVINASSLSPLEGGSSTIYILRKATCTYYLPKQMFVEGTHRMECEVLSEKLLSLCEKRRDAFP